LFPAFSIDKLDNDIKEGMIKNLWTFYSIYFISYKTKKPIPSPLL
jgi:hypothetical protein